MSQYGGAVDMSRMVPGSQRTLANGAEAARFSSVTKDGRPTERFLIYKGASNSALAAARAQRSGFNARAPITQAQAQAAYDKFYRDLRSSRITRGPRKGLPRYKNDVGLQRAKTYDFKHRSNVITDRRYLQSPHKYDFPGVDDGPLPAKRASAKQLANLSMGRSRLAATRPLIRRGEFGPLGSLGGMGYWE